MTTPTEYIQVGSSCLQNFLGLADPRGLCAQAELLLTASDLLSAAEEGGGGHGFGIRAFTTIDSYLPYVCASIRTIGWLSSTAARESGGCSTATDAFIRGVHANNETKDRLFPEEEDYNRAAATITFIEEYFEICNIDEISDYENSLRVAMASGIVHPKFIGIIASAVQFYQRDLERRARAESWSKLVAGSEFEGEVGDRQLFADMKVMSYRTWESNWGVTHFYSFLHGSNLVVYYASRDMHLSVGQLVSLKATIKTHTLYQPKTGGSPVKQTVVTRATLSSKAAVTSYEVVSKEETEVDVPAHDVNEKGEKIGPYDQAIERRHVETTMKTRVVKYHHYHLTSQDGRRYLCVSKSKRKGVVVGAEVMVEYVAEDLSNLNGGERPVSIPK